VLLSTRFAIMLVPLALWTVYWLVVRRYRKRLGVVTPVRRLAPAAVLPGGVACTAETDLRVQCERAGVVALILGVATVLSLLVLGQGENSPFIVVAAILVAVGPTWTPRILYVMRRRQPSPTYFRSEVREWIRSPYKSFTDPMEFGRYRLAHMMRPVALLALAMSAAMAPNMVNPKSTPLWRFVVPTAAFAFGYVLLRTASRLRSGVVSRSKTFSPTEFLELPVERLGVMLRSFSDDALRIASRPSLRLSEFEILSIAGRADRFERVMSWCFWPHVPAFALSDPGRLGANDLGFGRITLPESDPWQPLAEQLIERAEVILVLVGDSPSLLWEIDHLVATGLLRKALFVVPPTTSAVDTALRRVAERLRLPSEPLQQHPVIGFTVGDSGAIWYTAETGDEHAYAVMAEHYLLARGIPMLQPFSPMNPVASR